MLSASPVPRMFSEHGSADDVVRWLGGFDMMQLLPNTGFGYLSSYP